MVAPLSDVPQEGSSVFSLFSLIKLYLASLPLASSYSRVAVSSVFCAQNIYFSAQTRGAPLRRCFSLNLSNYWYWNALSLRARASPLRVLGFLRRSALRVWSRSVSHSYKDSYDSSAMPMGVASLNSMLPCAIATFPVSLPLSSPGDVWPRLPLLPSTQPWTSDHPPWPPQPKPQPLTPLFSNPPLCQTPGCRSVHRRSTLSPSHLVLSALRPKGFSTRVWFSSLAIPDVCMVFDYCT